MIKLLKVLLIITMLSLVLTCENQNGEDEELKDYSDQSTVPAPKWAKNGVIYQVFPRVFTQKGSFIALQNRLDYIEKLGVDIIWLMPIYPIGEKGRKGTIGSPFSVQDFRKINPDYGTKADFRNLVQEIHNRGLKVIIGMIPNHGSNDNVLMEEHPEWFMRDEEGNFTREVADWSDVTDFNYDNAQMRDYMIETMIYWVKEFDIDGYRCDVAGMVPYDFWEEALDSLREVKNDIYLLAEWEDPEILLTGFNSDYGWTEYHTMKDIRKKEKRTAEILKVVSAMDSLYPQNALPMRFLENHDEKRSLKMFGPAAIEAYATLLFTVPGIPLIYAGQEIGEIEKPSLFEKSTLKWEKGDTALQNMYKSLIQLRKQHSCFTNGNYTQLQTASMSGSIGAFLREDENSVAIVISNLKSKVAEKVMVSPSDFHKTKLKELMMFDAKNKDKKTEFGNIYFEAMPAFQTVVYVGDK